jgi:hypothetical protein
MPPSVKDAAATCCVRARAICLSRINFNRIKAFQFSSWRAASGLFKCDTAMCIRIHAVLLNLTALARLFTASKAPNGLYTVICSQQ